jgi:hypothetical protein
MQESLFVDMDEFTIQYWMNLMWNVKSAAKSEKVQKKFPGIQVPLGNSILNHVNNVRTNGMLTDRNQNNVKF